MKSQHRRPTWRDPQSAAVLHEIASQTVISAPLDYLLPRNQRHWWRRVLRGWGR